MKILFQQKRSLFPTDTGGKIRTLNILKHLAEWHDITYVCNLLPDEVPYLDNMRDLGLKLETLPWSEAPRGSARFYMDLVANLFSRFPYNVNKDFDVRLRNRTRDLLATGDFDLLICDFVQMARNATGLSGAPKLLFQHNVEAEIFERHARSDRSWAPRTYMGLQARKMRRFEARAGAGFDGVIAVSSRDRECFESAYGWTHVHTIDTAVDTEFFRPQGGQPVADRVVFVGSMDWLPNSEGIRWFVNDVWPKIVEARPTARLQVVGRNPDASVRELNSSTVEVVGTVADVRPYLAEATAVVVPLLVGGGTRIKIFEAMAMGKAVVSTTIGAEGLPVVAGEQILIGDTPDHFADQLRSLLDQPALAGELGERARNLVELEFSTPRIARQFEQICIQVAGQKSANQRPQDRVAVS